MKRIYLCAVFLFAFIISATFPGCGGIPSDIKKQCKNIPEKIASSQNKINQNISTYQDLTASARFQPLASSLEKDNVSHHFQSAREALNHADKMFKNELKPLADENSEADVPEVLRILKEVNTSIIKAEQMSRYPIKRAGHLKDVMDHIDTRFEKAVQQAEATEDSVENLQDGIVRKAKNDFPGLQDNIDLKFSSLVKMKEKSQAAQNRMENEYSRYKAHQETNWAVLADSTDMIRDNYNSIESSSQEMQKELNSLYTSYTKILKDMKSEYFVTVKRESWDNSQDYYTPHFATFTRKVSEKVYNFADTSNLEKIAEITPSFFKLSFQNHIGDIWRELKIDPAENWPGRGEDSAVFWFEDWYGKYYHKYILVTDGKKTETDWIEVDWETYENNFEYLGMAILSKPYGTFEDDALKEPAPPGMAYVGNPHYGSWQENQDGDRFWVWYGKYRLFSDLLFGPAMGFMMFSNFRDYRTNYMHKKAYFGKTREGYQKYGTRGVHTKKSPTFQNTFFAKRGGFRTQAPSARGAGASMRGGGPKGKGK